MKQTGEIRLQRIIKEGNTVQYDFSVSEGLKRYFSGEPFQITYDEDITSVPDAIHAVPFTACLLPLSWLTGCAIHVPELDEDFYTCLPEVRKGVRVMFPDVPHEGHVVPGRLQSAKPPAEEKAATFFSGGLDSVHTLLGHLDEKPELLCIWGSDIGYHNSSGWRVMEDGLLKNAADFCLPFYKVHSSFRETDREGIISDDFRHLMNDNYWHGLKHGIAIISHAAVYAYLHGLTKLYIASSHCEKEGLVPCASSPLTDNHVRFGACTVIHDAFEAGRQDKIRALVTNTANTGHAIPLHVCWKSGSGNNCCVCEKCYRTMTGLIVEGADPAMYGFPDAANSMRRMHSAFYLDKAFQTPSGLPLWSEIKSRMREQLSELKKSPYYDDIRYIEDIDFDDPASIRIPAYYLVRRKIGVFLQKLRWKLGKS